MNLINFENMKSESNSGKYGGTPPHRPSSPATCFTARSPSLTTSSSTYLTCFSRSTRSSAPSAAPTPIIPASTPPPSHPRLPKQPLPPCLILMSLPSMRRWPYSLHIQALSHPRPSTLERRVPTTTALTSQAAATPGPNRLPLARQRPAGTRSARS
jgi:hypothetical protein